MSTDSKIDLKRLRRLHRQAECPTVVVGPRFEISTSAVVQHVLTEPDGAPVLECCLPHHAAYAVEAWNQAPLLAGEVERLRRLLDRATDAMLDSTNHEDLARELRAEAEAK